MLSTSGAFTGGLPRRRRESFNELNDCLRTPIVQASQWPKGWSGSKSSAASAGAGVGAGAGAGAGADGGRRRGRPGESNPSCSLRKKSSLFIFPKSLTTRVQTKKYPVTKIRSYHLKFSVLEQPMVVQAASRTAAAKSCLSYFKEKGASPVLGNVELTRGSR